MTRSSRNERLLEAKRSYSEKPILRRETTCQSILGGAGAAMLVVFFVVSRLGEHAENDAFRWGLIIAGAVAFLGSVAAVLLVCLVTLTGPVCKNQLDFSHGGLETWGFAEKGSAAAISILCLVGAVFLARWALF